MARDRGNEDSITVYVAGKIKAAREEKGMCQGALGRAIGTTGNAISELESGYVPIPVSDLALIASAVEKSISFFFPEHLAQHTLNGLSSGQREIVTLYDLLEGYEYLQASATAQMQTLVETAERLANEEIRLLYELHAIKPV